MSKFFLSLLILLFTGVTFANQEILSEFNELASPNHSFSHDFVDKTMKMTLSCQVGDAQPQLMITMPQSFSFYNDPSVLVISSPHSTPLQIKGAGSLMNFTTTVDPLSDLWQKFANMQSDDIQLEAISYRSGKSVKAAMKLVALADELAKLKQDCQQ